MPNKYSYKIILKSGVVIDATRDEERSVIGLWKWSKTQLKEVVISFNECSVLASEIAVLYEKQEVF